VKADRYAALGVAHSWIVDPAHETLECYALRQYRYVSVLTAEGATLVGHPDWPELTIDLGALWR
jgi:hypothetical protein